MSEGPSRSPLSSPAPAHTADDLWYVQDEAAVLGPCDGSAVMAMIEAGSLGAHSLVARVGAAEWTPLGTVAAFAPRLQGRAGKNKVVKYAGFWIRLLAYVIDSVLFYVMAIVAGLVVAAVFVMGAGIDADDPQFYAAMQVIPSIMSLAVLLFYYSYFPSRAWQATPGKRICGIYIIREDGRRVTRLLALGRCCAYFVSALPLSLGFLMAAWSDQHKTLHDMMCGTRVVHGRL